MYSETARDAVSDHCSQSVDGVFRAGCGVELGACTQRQPGMQVQIIALRAWMVCSGLVVAWSSVHVLRGSQGCRFRSWLSQSADGVFRAGCGVEGGWCVQGWLWCGARCMYSEPQPGMQFQIIAPSERGWCVQGWLWPGARCMYSDAARDAVSDGSCAQSADGVFRAGCGVELGACTQRQPGMQFQIIALLRAWMVCSGWLWPGARCMYSDAARDAVSDHCSAQSADGVFRAGCGLEFGACSQTQPGMQFQIIALSERDGVFRAGCGVELGACTQRQPGMQFQIIAPSERGWCVQGWLWPGARCMYSEAARDAVSDHCSLRAWMVCSGLVVAWSSVHVLRGSQGCSFRSLLPQSGDGVFRAGCGVELGACTQTQPGMQFQIIALLRAWMVCSGWLWPGARCMYSEAARDAGSDHGSQSVDGVFRAGCGVELGACTQTQPGMQFQIIALLRAWMVCSGWLWPGARCMYSDAARDAVSDHCSAQSGDGVFRAGCGVELGACTQTQPGMQFQIIAPSERGWCVQGWLWPGARCMYSEAARDAVSDHCSLRAWMVCSGLVVAWSSVHVLRGSQGCSFRSLLPQSGDGVFRAGCGVELGACTQTQPGMQFQIIALLRAWMVCSGWLWPGARCMYSEAARDAGSDHGSQSVDGVFRAGCGVELGACTQTQPGMQFQIIALLRAWMVCSGWLWPGARCMYSDAARDAVSDHCSAQSGDGVFRAGCGVELGACTQTQPGMQFQIIAPSERGWCVQGWLWCGARCMYSDAARDAVSDHCSAQSGDGVFRAGCGVELGACTQTQPGMQFQIIALLRAWMVCSGWLWPGARCMYSDAARDAVSDHCSAQSGDGVFRAGCGVELGACTQTQPGMQFQIIALLRARMVCSGLVVAWSSVHVLRGSQGCSFRSLLCSERGWCGQGWL
ncbi:hypothetical protein NDU88_000597 [Pleurodeles waltl]|uniref:Uncharacterized protein n=1 Tax=Pleurodeles waltl TaxID=8319 RepID=A0AAV7LYJ8_PLEWA|nr:hypothetical protein NDU88_000597 [Pleurodeles waltl]